jgi:hypothetical protein
MLLHHPVPGHCIRADDRAGIIQRVPLKGARFVTAIFAVGLTLQFFRAVYVIRQNGTKVSLNFDGKIVPRMLNPYTRRAPTANFI